MHRYRKKRVVVDAYKTLEDVDVDTLCGTVRARKGDWIITGVKGEKYPCKPDIFNSTYEVAPFGYNDALPFCPLIKDSCREDCAFCHFELGCVVGNITEVLDTLVKRL